jgi:opacity protein-like surface antigen
MNRKGLLVLVVLAVVAVGNAFALPEFKLGVGGGGMFTGIEIATGVHGRDPSLSNREMRNSLATAGGGGFVFFDATFAELSLGFFGAGGINEVYLGGYQQPSYPFANVNPTYVNVGISYTGLTISFLGKYPIGIGSRGRSYFYPLLGITYTRILSAKVEGEKADDPEDSSALGFNFGVGFDWGFTDHIFLRLQTLNAVRLPSKAEKDTLERIKDQGFTRDTGTGVGINFLGIRLAVGYRF